MFLLGRSEINIIGHAPIAQIIHVCNHEEHEVTCTLVPVHPAEQMTTSVI